MSLRSPLPVTGFGREPCGYHLGKLSPRAVESFSVDENVGVPSVPPGAALDIGEDALAESPLVKGALGSSRPTPVGLNRKQLLAREPLPPRQQERMRAPELPMRSRELGELCGQVGSGMELWIREVAPNQADSIEAIEQRHQRTIRGDAVRASEIPVLDECERR